MRNFRNVLELLKVRIVLSAQPIFDLMNDGEHNHCKFHRTFKSMFSVFVLPHHLMGFSHLLC